MVDVGSEREGVAKPWNIIQDAILWLLFLFLFFLAVSVLVRASLSRMHAVFRYEPTFNRSLKHGIKINPGGEQ